MECTIVIPIRQKVVNFECETVKLKQNEHRQFKSTDEERYSGVLHTPDPF